MNIDNLPLAAYTHMAQMKPIPAYYVNNNQPDEFWIDKISEDFGVQYHKITHRLEPITYYCKLVSRFACAELTLKYTIENDYDAQLLAQFLSARDLTKIKLFLLAGANPNATIDYTSPLRVSVAYNLHEHVKCLLRFGANPYIVLLYSTDQVMLNLIEGSPL